MGLDYVISIYLDTRRPKDNGLYPVKLRVFNSSLKKAKLYPTEFDLSKKQFESAWDTVKPRNEYKELRLKLQAVENKANDSAIGLKPFTFQQFEKKLFRNVGDGNNVYNHYDVLIKNYNKHGQIGTAESYGLSQKSLKGFLLHVTGREQTKLSFSEITPDWLKDYERYMIKEKTNSRTTVGIYLRCLRAIFNIAIAEKEIDPELYPFGKKKYQIPSSRKVKKALGQLELKGLLAVKPPTPEQEKAKDFWFFSFISNGINIKDIALLRNKNISKSNITFFRAKTINTSKEDLKPITVTLTKYSKTFLKKYGSKNANPEGLVFSIINDQMSDEQKHRAIKNFTRFVNQNLKILAKSIGLTGDISTYWARHSFATSSLRKGAKMEFVTDALGHGDTKTTMNYFAGFEEGSNKEFMEKLMKF